MTGHPQFVYVAGGHGAIAIDNALREAGRTVDYRTMPRVTFTSPAIASAGLTEAEARQAGMEVDARVVPLAHVPRALVDRDTRRLVKMVAERGSGRIVGVHLLARNAGDVILAGVYALDAGMTVSQVAGTWSPYLTMGEAIKLAAQAFAGDIAKLSCCAVTLEGLVRRAQRHQEEVHRLRLRAGRDSRRTVPGAAPRRRPTHRRGGSAAP